MTEAEFQQSREDALHFQCLSVGPELFFWLGYELGLRNYHDEKFITESDYPDIDEEKHNWFMVGEDLESLGYRAGFAGLPTQDALEVGKKGIFSAGLNGNFHTEGSLGEMGVIYQGGGKWILPKGAKIHLAQKIESYYRNQDGNDWELRLADGSTWIAWSENIAGIDGLPGDK